ncbi:biotin transporter BioY [Leptothrix discophora]|uniref:Biotin transporter n=1 Tax=Leptothrix discophora TaxID=89 RepID=A0ABT9G818_LEPDI|nr:biotin transporter BioY [Leptothrix discophora]MDP4302615.1 biotin transporter BioY [Leptothrix discophora]
MNNSSRQIATVSLFAALIAVFGLIPKIDLPLGVPITLQTLGVMLAGALLRPRQAFLAVALLLAAVALGLPLLSGGRGGPAVFFAPSAGYLIGWPLGAWVTALVMQALPTAAPRRAAVSAFFAAVAGGLLVVHACGVVGLMLIAQLPAAKALLGTLLFVPGDLIKAVVTAGVVHTVARGLPDWQLGGGNAR